MARLPSGEYIRKTLEDDMGRGVNYHLLSDGTGVTYFVAASSDIRIATAFHFLEDLHNGFINTPRSVSAAESLLKTKMERATSVDTLSHVSKEIDNVKDIMIKNMDSVIIRGDHLESMAQRSAQLVDEASRFQHGATKMKRMEWFRNVKMLFIGFAVLCILIFVILMIACKPNFSKCR
eukprot:CAMPEP_0201499578 /NCGR_PEP_ID=MMETSP0151_2-20130828/76750_1 /ASSEMBLY_ACC=CAM_ASM_000257 /TAXON_ID=200890 /ORGANISM="Paramoeba atlantica, Strain 621/1 / CCAP 1560/9" /LENGTH=177 /DNA_ID=CAMNT_0047892019 /DNA_START=93 /DNA_END=626 /DNA_ORIENTATION=+